MEFMEDKDSMIVMIALAGLALTVLYRWLSMKTPEPKPEPEPEPEKKEESCPYCNEEPVDVLVVFDKVGKNERIKKETRLAIYCPICGKKIKDPPGEEPPAE
ncbi:MAG: hypothetical protein J6B17_01520 [Ruminococcus sp.]|nr:hypothetical protein [Ruminococcus sp.]